MQKNQIRPYNEEHHSGIVRHILIRTGYHTKEIMVCLIVNAAKASCLKMQNSSQNRCVKWTA